MSDETPRLKLAQLVSLQELNAVTWNEALAQLDALVDLFLLGQYENTPPASPQDGDAYLVGGTPTGAWSGYAYKIASCLDGAWRFYTPFNGLRAYVVSSGVAIVYVNGTWAALGGGSGSGDVAGPAASVSGNLAGFSGTSGKLLQDSGLAASSVVTLAGSQALTNKTYNGNTWTSGSGTLAIAAGKTFTSSNSVTIAGTDGAALNIGTGGTLGSGAFAAAYSLPVATASVLGGIKPDGTTITVSAGGVASAVGGGGGFAVAYDVILVAGQSNAVGNGTPLSYPTDYGDARILQYANSGASAGTIIPANEPLAHPVPVPGAIGFAVAFAKEYIKHIPLNRSVLLVPYAIGGSGYSTNTWNPGNSGFSGAVTAANAALAASPAGSSIVGILWHQGEVDGMAAWSSGDYAYALDAMIAAFRSQLTNASGAWFVLGQIQPGYLAYEAAYMNPINAAHINTPARVLNTAFWYGNATGTADIHYDAPAQRLNGLSAYVALHDGLSASTSVPGQVTGLSAPSTAAGQVSLSWTAPSSGAIPTDYLVEYKLHADSSWSVFSHSRSPATAITVTGLTAGSSYDFRVSAVSTPGTGTASAVVTATAAAAATAFDYIASYTFTGSNAAGSPTTAVNRYNVSGMTNIPSGAVTKFKLRVTGPVTRVFIGLAASSGDSYDAASLTQAYFGGSPGVSQALDASTLSDEVTLSWDKAIDIIVSVECASGITYAYRGGSDTSVTQSWYLEPVLQANVADKTGYTASGAYRWMVSGVQCNGF